MGSHSVKVMVVSGMGVGGKGCGCGVADGAIATAVGVREASGSEVLVQAVDMTSRTKNDRLVDRRKMWNMLALNGVMVTSAPIIAQANAAKSLIQRGQLVL